jgi:hypothetical protein
MKNRSFLLLMVISVMLAVIAMDYGSAFAHARATAKKDSCESLSAAHVRNGPVGFMRQTCGELCTTYAIAGSSNDNGSQAAGIAYAYNTPRLATSTYELLYLAPGDWGWAKGEQPSDTLVVEDSLTCEIQLLSGDSYELRSEGDMKLYPRSIARETWAHLEATVYEAGNQDNVAFWGKISLTASGPHSEGDYDPSELDSWSNGDTLFVSIDVLDTLVYTGDPDSLTLDLSASGRATQVPITTPWGVVILVALIITSAVYITLRKRRKATMVS